MLANVSAHRQRKWCNFLDQLHVLKVANDWKQVFVLHLWLGLFHYTLVSITNWKYQHWHLGCSVHLNQTKDRTYQETFLYLAEIWPTWLQKWPAVLPACWVWSWAARRCQAVCCHSPSRWAQARWPWVQTAWWEQAEACTWGWLAQACCRWALMMQGAVALSSWLASCFFSLRGHSGGEKSRKEKKKGCCFTF